MGANRQAGRAGRTDGSTARARPAWERWVTGVDAKGLADRGRFAGVSCKIGATAFAMVVT
jgi:hypothetical protein